MRRTCLFCGYPLNNAGKDDGSVRCPACDRENRADLFPVTVRWKEEGLPFHRISLQMNIPFGSCLLVGQGQKAVLEGAGEKPVFDEGRYDLFLHPSDPSVLYLAGGKYRIDSETTLLFLRTETSRFLLRSECRFEAGKTGIMIKPEYNLIFPVPDAGKTGRMDPEDIKLKLLEVLDQYALKAAAGLPPGTLCGSDEDKTQLIRQAEAAFPEMGPVCREYFGNVLPEWLWPESVSVVFTLSEEAASGNWECPVCGRKMDVEGKMTFRCPNCNEPLFWCYSCGKYVRRTFHAWCAECGGRIYPIITQ